MHVFDASVGTLTVAVVSFAVNYLQGGSPWYPPPYQMPSSILPHPPPPPLKVTAPPCSSWDGQDVRVEVVFEPECTGEVGDTLVVSSPEHGSYRCKLRGMCSPPLPQVRPLNPDD